MSVNKIQSNFIPMKGSSDAVFILRLQEKHNIKDKILSEICRSRENTVNSTPRTALKWVMPNGIPQVLHGAVMINVYRKTNTRDKSQIAVVRGA